MVVLGGVANQFYFGKSLVKEQICDLDEIDLRLGPAATEDTCVSLIKELVKPLTKIVTVTER